MGYERKSESTEEKKNVEKLTSESSNGFHANAKRVQREYGTLFHLFYQVRYLSFRRRLCVHACVWFGWIPSSYACALEVRCRGRSSGEFFSDIERVQQESCQRKREIAQESILDLNAKCTGRRASTRFERTRSNTSSEIIPRNSFKICVFNDHNVSNCLVPCFWQFVAC